MKTLTITKLSAVEYDVKREDSACIDGHVRLETDELGWVLDVYVGQSHDDTLPLGKHRPNWTQVVNQMLNWRE